MLLSVHAQQTDGLQQRMSAEEFKAAGLDKLSPQELQNLDGWLSAHAKVTTRVVTKVVTETGTPGVLSRQSEAHTYRYSHHWAFRWLEQGP